MTATGDDPRDRTARYGYAIGTRDVFGDDRHLVVDMDTGTTVARYRRLVDALTDASERNRSLPPPP